MARGSKNMFNVESIACRAAHQPCDPFAGGRQPQSEAELGMHPWCSVGVAGVRVDLEDQRCEPRVLDRSRRGWARYGVVERRAWQTQHPAGHRDGEPVRGELADQPRAHWEDVLSREGGAGRLEDLGFPSPAPSCGDAARRAPCARRLSDPPCGRRRCRRGPSSCAGMTRRSPGSSRLARRAHCERPGPEHDAGTPAASVQASRRLPAWAIISQNWCPEHRVRLLHCERLVSVGWLPHGVGQGSACSSGADTPTNRLRWPRSPFHVV